jgi:transposase
MTQRSFFDEGNRLALLSAMGDPLEVLDRAIKWEDFRSVIERNIRHPRSSMGGRPPFDVVLMFKILVLQRLYNLSDDQTTLQKFQINDRMTFMRFLNLGLNDKVPDAKTIWKFRNDLATGSVARVLFKIFDERLLAEDLITHNGSIVDATFVEAP